jgi:hypothetical protein
MRHKSSRRIRSVRKLSPEDWPHEAFAGFESPYSDALAKAFPLEVIAAHVARLPQESRARLEREFGKLPTTEKPIP